MRSVSTRRPDALDSFSSNEAHLARRVLAREIRYVILAVIAAAVCTLGVVFDAEIRAAVNVWLSSATYNHCFLIVPLAAYLVWLRWDLLMAYQPDPRAAIALIALPVAASWFVAERVGIMEARQLLAMGIVQILFISVLGLRTWRAISLPLGYLFFAVPFGEFLTPQFQVITTRFVQAGLDLFGVVNFVDDINIQIPEGHFYVAEACAGMRFLIASLAFGVFYACVMYKSLVWRLTFIACSVVVPIIANGLRALGIILTAHFLGNAQAATADHVLYGWVFFSLVTGFLIVSGLLFREEAQSASELIKVPPSSQALRRGITCAILVCLIAGMFQLTASTLDQRSGRERIAGKVDLPPPPSGCALAELAGDDLRVELRSSVNAASSQAYQCGRDVFVLTVLSYPRRVGARPVYTALRHDVTDDSWGEAIRTRYAEVFSGPERQLWAETDFSRPGRFAVVGSALWVNGKPASGIMGRINQALNSIRGSAIEPVVATVAYATSRSPDEARLEFNAFLTRVSSSLPVTPGETSYN